MAVPAGGVVGFRRSAVGESIPMESLTRWILAHRRLVVGLWVVLTVIGVLTASAAVSAMNQKFTVPGREGWEANQSIAQRFGGTGGDAAPLVPVVTLRAGQRASDTDVRRDLAALEQRLAKALPGARIASAASADPAAFSSKDGRTTFAVAYPKPDPAQPFGENPKAEVAARAALRGMTVGGAPVRLSGFDALSAASGDQGGGAGLLLEALLGGVGALIVLAFVFGSLLAFLPLLMAIPAILTSFLAAYGLTTFTGVSPVVQFLIALIGLGVAIDYALIIVVRWREEIARGARGRRGDRPGDEHGGPRGRVQRDDRRGRPARAGRAAGAVPALGRLRRAADPADLGARGADAAAVRAADARPEARMAASAHRRAGLAPLDRVGARRGPPSRGRDRRLADRARGARTRGQPPQARHLRRQHDRQGRGRQAGAARARTVRDRRRRAAAVRDPHARR